MTGNRDRVEVYQDKRGQWRFRVVSANNRILAQGESYTRRRDAIRAVHRLIVTLDGCPVEVA